jgi:hypothetical protein
LPKRSGAPLAAVGNRRIDDQHQYRFDRVETHGTLNGFCLWSWSKNSQGDSAHQVALSVCAAPQHWDQASTSCRGGPIHLNPGIVGITAGETYTYAVKPSTLTTCR